MDNFVNPIVTLITTSVASILSWFLAKRKYNSEVDTNEIENLKKSLEFYEKIVEDYNTKLQFYIKLAQSNKVELYRVKGILYKILNNSCTNNMCTQREFYSESETKEILGDFEPYKDEAKDETNS